MLAHRYEPVAEIGVGGMGAVVLARALSGPSAGEHVAMKRLLPHLAQDPEVLKAFLDEVYVISAMHHPHIVESLDWGEDTEGRFLVMQFVPGDSLRALIHARQASQTPLPIALACEIVACAARGLHAAHNVETEGTKLAIVHQDVSPANVLVGYDGSVKVIDFGVARILSREDEQPDESHTIRGKFGYMSPEQIRGLPLDHRSDVFALGVILWESLTLCRLYSSTDQFDIAHMVCAEEPVAPSELRQDIPPELDRIVLKCLAKNRDDRFATARDLARALRPFCPHPKQSPELVANLCRDAMIERFAWIETVTGRKIPLQPARHASADDPDSSPQIATQAPSASADAAVSSTATSAHGTQQEPLAPFAQSASPTPESAGPPPAQFAPSSNAPLTSPSARTQILAPKAASRPRPAPPNKRITLVRMGALAAIALIALAIGLYLGSR